MAESKLGFLGPPRSTPGQIWSKLLKISEKLRFEVKLWKMLFCEGFDFIWPSVNLRLTRGILVILAEKCTLGTLVSEGVGPYNFGCSHSPHREKTIFLDFLESNMQIVDEQNTISTICLLISSNTKLRIEDRLDPTSFIDEFSINFRNTPFLKISETSFFNRVIFFIFNIRRDTRSELTEELDLNNLSIPS